MASWSIGSRIFHKITNNDRQRDDGPNNRSRSWGSWLAGIISRTTKPPGVCTWPISRLCYIGGGIYIYITYTEAPATGSLFYYRLMRQGQEATDTVGFVTSGFCKNNMHIMRKDENLISDRINIRRITWWHPVEDDFVHIKWGFHDETERKSRWCSKWGNRLISFWSFYSSAHPEWSM